MKTYNKLVRDNIPEIIVKDGKSAIRGFFPMENIRNTLL